jgi:hypothetical protein
MQHSATLHTMLGLVAMWAVSAAAVEPSLTAKRLGEASYELHLVTDQTADVSVAQRALLPAAEQLCAGKTPRFGHYKFESTESLPGQPPAPRGITLTQQVHCELAAAPSLNAPQQLVAHDDRAIEELTTRYLAAKDAGTYEEAYALFGPSMKASTSLESWSNKARSFNAKAGKVKNRKIKKITWYDNPASAPVPGTYAAADYGSEFANMHVHCGYVVWLGKADGSFQIVREEENYIDRGSASQLSPERIKAFADRFGCEVR